MIEFCESNFFVQALLLFFDGVATFGGEIDECVGVTLAREAGSVERVVGAGVGGFGGVVVVLHADGCLAGPERARHGALRGGEPGLAELRDLVTGHASFLLLDFLLLQV